MGHCGGALGVREISGGVCVVLSFGRGVNITFRALLAFL